jgi:hypothetical protein
MSDHALEPRTVKGLRNVNSPDFLSIYSNNAALSVNFFDVSFVFGEMQGIDDDGMLKVEQRLKVTMTPTQAKILSILLFQQISMYEARFGQINLPSEVIPPELVDFMKQAVAEPEHTIEQDQAEKK